MATLNEMNSWLSVDVDLRLAKQCLLKISSILKSLQSLDVLVIKYRFNFDIEYESRINTDKSISRQLEVDCDQLQVDTLRRYFDENIRRFGIDLGLTVALVKIMSW